MSGLPFPDHAAGGSQATPVEVPEDITTNSEIATDANATISAAEILGGIYNRLGTFTAPRTHTLATAALLVAAIPNAAIGDTFKLYVMNHNLAAQNFVLEAGVGGTHKGAAGDLTLAQNEFSTWLIQLKNVTAAAEAYDLFRVA